MKKTGKALSLVLSLALVASSIPMAFASAASTAATEQPVVGAAVEDSNSKVITTADTPEIALAVKKGTAPAGVAITPAPTTMVYTAANGAQYTATVAPKDITWTSTNSSVAKISKDSTDVIPVAAGETTLTCTVAPETLTYGSTSTVKAGASYSVKVKVYNEGDVVLTDVTTADGVVPKTTTQLAVNAAPTYTAYTVTVGADDGTAKFTATAAGDASGVPSTDATIEYASQNGKVCSATPTGGTSVTVTPQSDPDKLYIGQDQIKVGYVKSGSTDFKFKASLPVKVVKAYDVSYAKAATTVGGDSAYGSSVTTVKDDDKTYDVTGYDFVDTNGPSITKTLTVSSGKIGNVDISGAVTINGGTVGNVTSGDKVTISVAAGATTAANVGSVDGKAGVAVSDASDKAAVTTGNIASDGAVAISGANTKVGDVRVLGGTSAINNTLSVTGATTGSLTGVPAYTDQTSDVKFVYPTVAVEAATVNGSITGNTVTVKGTAANGENDAVPATVNGNISIYTNTDTSGTAGAAIIGRSDADTAVDANVTVTGTIVDKNGGSTITLLQNYDDTKNPKITNKVTVGGINGFAPDKASDPYTTNVSFVNFTGSFASLPNVNNVSVDANSDVKVAAPVTSRSGSTLKVEGLAEFAGATFGTVAGTGTIKMPAGSLTAMTTIGDSATPITFESTTPVKENTVLFSSVVGKEDNVKVKGVTLASKANGESNGYDYYAKSVVCTSLGITGDGITAGKTLSVPQGTAAKLTASCVPDGTSLPEGDTIAWRVNTADNKNIALTDNKDGTASVKATGYDKLDANGVNDVTVTAYVATADGNEVYDYKEDSVTVSAAAPIPLKSVTVSPATAEVTAEKPVTLTLAADPANAYIPDDAKIIWTSDSDNFKVVPSADGKTATVSIAKAPEKDETAKITVTVAGKTATATVTAKADLTGVTVSPATAEVKADAPATLTVAPNPANAQLPADAKITWASDNDNFTVTPSADGKTATVSVAKAPEKDITADVTVKVNDFTATAKVTAKAATTPVVKPGNFTIDSMPKTMKLGQVYTVKINSKDGSKPSYAFANGFAVITKNVTKGNDTFLTFTAQSTGDHGVYIGDKKVAIINVAGSICDTRTVTVKQGKVYQFKVTSKSTPVFTVATVGTLKPVRVSGHDYFYKVTATSNKGDHGVYVNGAKIAHCIFA